MKKLQKTLVKEMFTKTFDQRYKEMSKSEKIGYWIFFAVVVSIMALMAIFGN